MAINLPKKEKCVRSDASGIVKELKSLIAYSGTAKSTYEFYEVIDNWLGQWKVIVPFMPARIGFMFSDGETSL